MTRPFEPNSEPRADVWDRVPLVALRDVLLCTLPSMLDDELVRGLRERVGLELKRRNVRALVIDASAVDAMDSYITRSIRDVAMAARCMGTETVVCGLRPDVVATLVDMGMSLERVRTALDLDRAMAMVDRQDPIGLARARRR